MSSFLTRYLNSIVFAGASLVLVACGGGGGGSESGAAPAPTQQGYFIDSAVGGLNYSASPSGLEGITDEAGEYGYKTGDIVTFSIGNLVLGSAPAAGIITPLDLVPGAGTDTNNQQVVNISRLLISLDSDGNPDNGITLSQDVSRLAAENLGEGAEIDFSSESFATDAQEIIDVVTEGTAILVSEQDAQDHMTESLANTDGDDEIDLIDTDDDGDDVADGSDNCPLNANADQLDTDGDDSGDACDSDDDGDEIADDTDNCPLIVNANQLDIDSDNVGNTCDTDDDNDGVVDTSDNCPLIVNTDQLDTDSDLLGNACDSDDDGDGVADDADAFPLDGSESVDTDGDGIGNNADTDDDNDQIPDAEDDNPLVADSVMVTISGEIVNGSIIPAQTQVLNQGKQVEFTVTPDEGYRTQISGCEGGLSGNIYTISEINNDCIVSVSFYALVQPSTPLNDTGIIRCANTESNDLDCAQEGFPGQDAENGRDVSHNDDSDGYAGFSFTKICNSGQAAGEGDCPVDPPLGSGVNGWGCTHDNVTGLLWEVKTDDGGVRDKDNYYTWYNSDPKANGGWAGEEDEGGCPDEGKCDTEKYVASVNETGLCGFNDGWRMPHFGELLSIVNFSTNYIAIDMAYFPNTYINDEYYSGEYWTASPSASEEDAAWIVNFYFGSESAYGKVSDLRVRLVRSNNN